MNAKRFLTRILTIGAMVSALILPGSIALAENEWGATPAENEWGATPAENEWGATPAENDWNSLK